MTFAYPDLLAVAVLAPLIVLGLAAWDHVRRQAVVRQLGHVPQVQRMLASASAWRRWTKTALVALGLCAIALAAARPQRAGKRDGSKEGLDLVIGLDVSKSMLVSDVDGTRLAKARAFVDALLPKLVNDRVGAMVFAGTAAHFPLTDDKEVGAQFLRDLGPADLPGGSNLDEAFRVATCVLRPDTSDPWGGRCAGLRGRGHGGDPLPGEPADTPVAAPAEEISDRSKVFMLITDGADRDRAGDGVRAALEQAAQAKQLGVTLIVVGVGTPSGGNVPDIDADGRPSGWKYDAQGKIVRSALDPSSLRTLAEAGGDPNRYIELGPGPPPVDAVVVALDALTRGSLAKRDERVMDEWYAAFLFPGFMLLLIEACLGTRRRVRFPEG
ncbi:MAG: VWA domain-containing protein [Myxococcales bacterium]|nr:VWA domain-containing protein [Myxococcales bacterium]MBK7196111.1 VWA domain-containing protein [Myxococcales bacterium]MBP6847362.1 VWA domain-containing protein [Kofleriaceae bacterium]